LTHDPFTTQGSTTSSSLPESLRVRRRRINAGLAVAALLRAQTADIQFNRIGYRGVALPWVKFWKTRVKLSA
jgi:hypothetical protein